MLRIKSVGTGWTGGPGLTTFYMDSGIATIDAAMANGVTGRVRAYFDALKVYTTSAITWQVDPVVDIVDDEDGSLAGQVVASSAPSAVVGTGAGVIGPAFVCAVGKMRTNVFSGGRRIQGRTFYGPLAQAYTDSATPEGGLTAAQATGLTAVLTAAGGPTLVVWHRPKGAAPGFMAPVLTVSSSSVFGILKSRR